MLKKNESGRSMVEMLGVLTIVGVLSVGGLNVINQMQNERTSTQMLADISDLARRAKRMACQYDSGYSSYTFYLYKSNAYPEGWNYDSTKKKFSGLKGSLYSVQGTANADSGVAESFEIIIENLSDEQCSKLATFDWGGKNTSGIESVMVNNATDAVAVVGTDSYPMTFSKATTKCDQGNANKIELKYLGCN